MCKACPKTIVTNPTPRTVWLVGPTHPYTGGIAQHTTRLAAELEARGVVVGVESWKSQYPSFLYKGTARVPRGEPEMGEPSTVVEALAWYSPASWFLAGRRLAGADRIVVSVPTAFHALPYTVMAWGVGGSRKMWAIVHNVLPHDSGRLSKKIMGWFLRRLGRIIVHSDQQHSLARQLGVDNERITVRRLPSPWPDEPVGSVAPHTPEGHARALFFGTIRPYKGLDLLVEALSHTPDVSLTIAGEFWEDRERYDDMITRWGVSDRVTIRPGYVAASEMAELFAGADCLILPYRSGTGSIVRDVGFRFGVPVIATNVGSIADGITHDTNGWVVETPSVDGLVDALNTLQDPATRHRWRAGVTAAGKTNQERWGQYVDAIIHDYPG